MELLGEDKKLRYFKAGEIVIREGDASDFIYLIRSGTAKVINQYETDNESVITLLGEGETFGELGIILQRERLATVIALTELTVELIDPDEYNALFETELGKKLRPVFQSMAERIRISGIKLTEMGYNIVFDSGKQIREDIEIRLIADSELAQKALQGKEVVQISKFPFRVGRFSDKKSDNLFHKNDLYLYEDKPYKISLSQFSIIKTDENYYFVDRNGGIGNIVNGVKIGGFDSSTRKIPLKKGENIIYLGKEHYNVRFKIVI
ncbi:MAG: cyclic nucleotide-binding domain-containing protein [Candidatus Cloacimonetes bacterium]|nr:cyclic nucleotide-binding domain-containing protein [Candidatus Cloacimonadota bacterium]